MTIINAIILGIIQGIAEFLPISSSGHLVIMKDFLGIKEIPLLFDILMHVPTLLAIILVFRKRLASIFSSLFRFLAGKRRQEDTENLFLILWIILGSLPTALLGFIIKKGMDALGDGTGNTVFTLNPWIVSILFLCTAIILLITRNINGKKNYQQFGVKGGLLVGIVQGIGVLPGISRSGITIAGGVMGGLEREKAGELSFLISIPAILGASLLEIKDIGGMHVSLPVLGAGLITSFLVGILSLILLMKLIRKGRLYLFSLYLIPLGLVSLLKFILL